MSMQPDIQSSTFSGSNYSSVPAGPPEQGIGTTGWFKEHALLILLLVISLVSILWFLSRRTGVGTGVVNPDQGYPLGYPTVGTGTSGGAGASSGGSGGGTGDTGVGATASDQAIKDFLAGFQLRDNQINSSGTTAVTATAPSPTPLNIHVTSDPVTANVVVSNPTPQPAPQAVTTPPPAYVPPTSSPASIPYPVGTVYTANIGREGVPTTAVVGSQHITYTTPTNKKTKTSILSGSRGNRAV